MNGFIHEDTYDDMQDPTGLGDISEVVLSKLELDSPSHRQQEGVFFAVNGWYRRNNTSPPTMSLLTIVLKA